jgi:hypothetical protein
MKLTHFGPLSLACLLAAACPHTDRPPTKHSPTSRAAKTGAGTPSAAEVIKRVERALAGLRSYRAELSAVFRPQGAPQAAPKIRKATAVIAVERPSRIKLELQQGAIGRQPPTRFTITCDTKTALVQMALLPPGKPAHEVSMRVDQGRLKPRSGCYSNVNLWPMVGLSETAELIDTLQQMFGRRRFRQRVARRTRAGRSCLELQSDFSEKAAVALLFDRPALLGVMLRMVRPPIPTMPRPDNRGAALYVLKAARPLAALRICVDPTSWLPRWWAFGRDAAKPQLEVTLSKLESTQLPPRTFTIDPALRGKARDVTNFVVVTNTDRDAKLADQERRAVLREAIDKLLEGKPASRKTP